MSRRHRDKGKIEGPFVPMLVSTLSAPAWRAMSPSARVLYIAIKARYSFTQRNNGRVYLSLRAAAQEIGLDKATVSRAFRELQHYGFIVMTSAGCLGVDGKGKAPHWRLTELGYMRDPPTREFMRWNGLKFHDPKKQNPVRTSRTPCPNGSDIEVSENLVHLDDELSEPFVHTDG